MTDRVAITGIGLIGPAGIGLAACLARLAEGPLVAAQPPADEAPAVPAPALLDVPAGFKPQQYLERRKDLKLMARANRLAVAAACLACEDAGLDFAALCDAALMLGVGREPGSLDDILPALSRSHDEHGRVDLGRLVAEGMGCMNPLSSLKTLPNMSLAHVAIRLGAMGPSQTRCAGPDAGLAAVLEAVHALREGRAPLAIAGATDHRTSFTDRLTAARLAEAGEGDAEAPVAEGAALLVLEPLAAARARGARVYAVLDVAEKPGPEPAGAFGDCGAATALIDAVLAMARGEPGHAGSLVFAPPAIAADRRAPAVHIRRGDDPVAITGVGLATPLGQRMADFTPALLAGKCGTGPIQAFDAPGFPVKNACEIRDFSAEARLPAELHAAVAGLDDRKAELALAAAIDAVRSHGGFDLAAGVAYGTGLSSVSVRELEQDYLPFLTADGALDFAAFGRGPHPKRPQSPWRHLVDRPVDLLRRHLRLRGPGSCHFSACAAAAEAIGHAADRIRRGEVPMMLAGGADSMVHPFGMLPFILLGATSPEADPGRAGRPFDQDRDGFVMGEGGAFVVLEPLSRARAAGRTVHGVLLGWGTSCDAHNVTAPHPEGLGAERAMRAALADAGLDAEQIDYVNAHGTGTRLNDVTEAAAIRRLFGAKAPPVSSSKAQLGHTIAAAGAVELLACLAAFAGERLPPNPHLDRADREIDLDLVEPEGRAGAPRFLLSNSFGFGGQNACLALAHPGALS